jgi:hypothetical protein
MKKYLILAALAAGGLALGVFARGVSDGKGWTTYSG